MFKRSFTFLLAVVMLLSLAGCSETTDVRGDITPNPTTAVTTEAATEATTEPTTEPTTEATTEPAFDIGSSIGNTYKNAFIGIQCTLDENWTLMTDDEIRARNEATLGLVGDDYKALLSNASIIFDMVATHANGMNNVNILLEKTSVTDLLMTEEQYLFLAKDNVVGGLQSMGFTVDSLEIDTLQFAGKNHAAMTVAGSFAGVPFYERMVVVKCNGYVACITVASWLENTCADMLSQFQPYE